MTQNSINIITTDYRIHKYYWIGTSKLQLEDDMIDLYV